MSQGLYLDGSGFFYRLNPPLKILMILLSFIPPLLFSHPLYTAMPFMLLLGFVIGAGAGANLWRLRLLIFILTLMSMILWSLFRAQGAELFSLGPIRFTEYGLLFGLAVGLKLDCFLFSAVLLVSTTKVEEFSRGLTRLGLPFRAAFALSLAFRLVPLFMETGRTIIAAQQSRGLNLEEGGILVRARKHIPIFVPILLSAIRRTDSMACALEARGFGVKGQRTSISDRPATWRDGLVISVAILLVVGSVALRWLGYGVL